MAAGAGSIIIDPEEPEYRYHPLAGRIPVSRRGTPRVTPRRASQPLPRQSSPSPEPEPVPAQPQPAPHLPADPEPDLPEPVAVAPPQYQPPEQPLAQPQVEEPPFDPQADPGFNNIVLALRAAMQPLLPEIAQRVQEEIDLEEVEAGVERVRRRLEDFAEGATNLNRRITEIEQNLVRAVNNSYEAHQEAQRAKTAINQTPTWVDDLLRGNNEALKAIRDLREESSTTMAIIQAIDDRVTTLGEKIDQVMTNTALAEAPQSTRRNIVPPHRSPSPPGSPERRSRSRTPRRERHQRSRSPGPERIPKGAKAKKPEPFEGKRKDDEAELFLMRTEVYFRQACRARIPHAGIRRSAGILLAYTRDAGASAGREFHLCAGFLAGNRRNPPPKRRYARTLLAPLPKQQDKKQVRGRRSMPRTEADQWNISAPREH
ncbi:hypothetical protein FRC06_001001 [Ceratobasidium sp. 370]|nr:hypothetical protein FRC06_001001 [Ceratobasidium sp. 370]